MLEDLKIEGTNSSPAVTFQKNGKLKLQGRSMPDNPALTFDPMFAWIKELKVEEVEFEIELNYLNTSSSKQLFNLLRILDENHTISKVIVNWHYEPDDDDHYETGMLFNDKLERTDFNFIPEN
jgi:hypothetical protein